MTVELKTGLDRPPRRDDYCTKVTSCYVAKPGTPHPLWSEFLDRITGGNVELQKFLQRYIGYCCTGDTREHVFVFAWGTGANGKGTFINTIVKIFGDYATIADMNTFLSSNNERHPADLAKLRGARLVVAQEVDKGRRWDEAKIKTLTGGDRITARFMRGDYFDFTPSFKLFVTGNHKPRLNSVDEAIRRRMLLVPFTVTIPENERDPELMRKLEAEHPAILRWAVDGCREWRRIGLAPPAVVRDATNAYFADQDTLGQWIDECVERAPNVDTLTRDLFAAWKLWCEPRKLRYGSEKSFSESLIERGFHKRQHPVSRRAMFVGVVLKP
jgi:putative DNA primase/helicase